MSKVFTSNQYIEKLKHVASLPTIYYSVSAGAWASWNGKSWNFDCVNLIKALLWGWCEDKNKPHGGAKYLSNGVPDVNANGLIKECYDVSTDFKNIAIGEVLWMSGHVGTYIGNGKVIEATSAWDYRVQYSEIGTDGRRSKNGIGGGYWKKHGKMPWIEYSTPQPTPTPSQEHTGTITYQAYDGVWLSEVNKCDNTSDGYAGRYGRAISGIKARPQYGEIFIQSHIIGTTNYLPKISSKDYYKNNDDSYSGIYGKPIDCVKISSTKGFVKYRVHIKNGSWLSWVDSRTTSGSESYAGIYGKEIDGIQMY